MAHKNALAALAAFLPKLVLEQIIRRGSKPPVPSVESFDGVLLWADVSGFTPLVERLSRDGSAGAERLSQALGAHFGRLIELTEEAGGDLLFLAGDGALALWRAAPGEALATTLARATAAARAIIGELDGSRPQPDVSIRLRVALAAGPLDAFSVGGVDGRWLDLVAGKPLRELAAGAGPGQIAVAPSARPEARATGPGRSGFSPSAPVPAGLEAGALLPHLVPSLASRIEARQRDFLAELRAMTVVFADLSGLGQRPQLALLQEVAAVVQAAAADFGGTIYQLVQDDKGTSAVAVFGLPGCSHEDDPVRAVRFAHRLAERLPPLIAGVSQGISTGTVFSGPCGLPRRCQYALFGRPMNRAARLMAAAGGAILLDEETHRTASHQLELGPPRQLALKGLDEPLTAYAGDLAPPRAHAAAAGLLGRQREQDLLLARVDALTGQGHGGVVVVQGPPGIGKTSLLADLRRACELRGCPLAFGTADFVEGRTPFFALRSILREFLGIASVSEPEDVEARALGALRTLGENADLLPLLGQALGHPIPENGLMRQMTPAVRAENRSRLVLALVALAARRARWVAVVDDLHWSDAATAALLPQLAEIPGILWVLAGRPDDSPPAGVLGRLAARGASVSLAGLPADDVAALAAATLGTQAIPPPLTALLVERAGGNPLYSRELALALRETGRIVIEDGRCAMDPAFRPEAARDLPSSLAALIKSRIDRLPPGPQLTLRVASVIGQSFERRVLSEVATTSPAQLEESLAELAREGFLRAESGAGGEARYAFGHATVQAVAYELFPERQRAHLHQVTALALERIYGPANPPAYGRLSHHWNEAGDAAKATEYSALAARQALDGYANRDAVELARRALRNLEVRRGPRAQEVHDVERANLYALLAQAHYGLTEPREARAAFEEALRHAGFANPGGARGVLGGIARHLFGRLFGRARQREAEAEGTLRERVLAALGVLAEWITLDFWEGRLLEGAAKAFLGHRLSGRILSSPLAAEAVARLGYTLAVTPFRFLAEGELLRGVGLSVRSGDLQAMASSRVLLGMFYTLSGRPAEALRPLEEAQPPAEQLGAGLWRHRAPFMLGETLLCLGRFEEARAAFARAAELSIGPEPPVAGMSTSMSALALARLGRPDDALALLEGPRGLPLISGSFLPLQRFASLGVKTEVLMQLGRLDEALAVALEAAVLAARGQDCDVFFAGLHGHAAVAQAALQAWERARAGGRTGGGRAAAPAPELARLRAEAGRACARLARFARLYPTARPRADALRGRWLALSGRTQAALRVLGRARAAAEKMGLPHDSALAGRLLASVAARAGRARPAGSQP